MTRKILLSYYAATILFLILDYVFGINIRLAFIDESALIKFSYYSFCVLCLLVMVWRPAWSVAVGAFESLVTLIGIIMHMALRVMIPFDPVQEMAFTGVTGAEMINFILAGGIAYVAWWRGWQDLGHMLREPVE